MNRSYVRISTLFSLFYKKNRKSISDIKFPFYIQLALKLDPQNVQECNLDGCARRRCCFNKYLFKKSLPHFTHCNDWTDLECLKLICCCKDLFVLYI